MVAAGFDGTKVDLVDECMLPDCNGMLLSSALELCVSLKFGIFFVFCIKVLSVVFASDACSVAFDGGL